MELEACSRRRQSCRLTMTATAALTGCLLIKRLIEIYETSTGQKAHANYSHLTDDRESDFVIFARGAMNAAGMTGWVDSNALGPATASIITKRSGTRGQRSRAPQNARKNK